jgi:hypothetical protein
LTLILSPTQAQIQTALRSFLLSILPTGVDIIAAQVNRVPEPQNADFVLMTTLRRERIETNIDTYADCEFVGSIAATVLNVTQVAYGTINVGNQVFGSSVTANTVISGLGTGSGGIGTYNISESQTISSRTLACGTEAILQPTKVAIQLDVHGPNSADNAQIISTLFRDYYATQQFATSGYDIVPLYADDPHQIPFINAEEQYETRYVIEAMLQVNQIVSNIPQQFAAQLSVTLDNVEAQFPA